MAMDKLKDLKRPAEFWFSLRLLRVVYTMQHGHVKAALQSFHLAQQILCDSWLDSCSMASQPKQTLLPCYFDKVYYCVDSETSRSTSPYILIRTYMHIPSIYIDIRRSVYCFFTLSTIYCIK